MSAPAGELAQLSADRVPQVIERLETGFGTTPDPDAGEQHQFLLESLDRGEHERVTVWPAEAPLGVLYANSVGTAVPAGSPAAAPSLVAIIDRCDWRILIGPMDIGQALLDASGRSAAGSQSRSLFRRRVHAREQRFLSARRTDWADLPAPERPHGMRGGRPRDVEQLTDLACRLHVEDRMGPPIGRSGRASVRNRMRDTVARGHSWVVERDHRVVAKVDLSLCSPRRGAQIAGVYVDPAHRGEGIATGMVAAITADLLAQGLPVVTLHVRADNAPARNAYARAGFVDRAAWVLALR